MSSFMDHIIAPYLTSPLANSTKIYNNVYTNGPDISLSNYYRSTGIPQSDRVRIAINPVNIDTICAHESNITSENDSTNDESNSRKSMRKSLGEKKPYVARKLITTKKVTEPFKVVAVNCKNQGLTVEKILKQINMTKYQQVFKKIDVAKFKDMKEIDLNAIGITRASEIKTFMDVIKKVKADDFKIKK